MHNFSGLRSAPPLPVGPRKSCASRHRIAGPVAPRGSAAILSACRASHASRRRLGRCHSPPCWWPWCSCRRRSRASASSGLPPQRVGVSRGGSCRSRFPARSTDGPNGRSVTPRRMTVRRRTPQACRRPRRSPRWPRARCRRGMPAPPRRGAWATCRRRGAANRRRAPGRVPSARRGRADTVGRRPPRRAACPGCGLSALERGPTARNPLALPSPSSLPVACPCRPSRGLAGRGRNP